MRMFIVPIHTPAAVMTEETMRPFTTRTELAFTLEDTVFDPVSCANRPADFCHTYLGYAAQGLYGFAREGKSGEVYVLVVPGDAVNIL